MDLVENMLGRSRHTRRAPNHQYDHAFLAATYAQLGQTEDAHVEAAKVLRLNPDYTIRKQKEVSVLKRKEGTDHPVAGLRRANLPEQCHLGRGDMPRSIRQSESGDSLAAASSLTF